MYEAEEVCKAAECTRRIALSDAQARVVMEVGIRVLRGLIFLRIFDTDPEVPEFSKKWSSHG